MLTSLQDLKYFTEKIRPDYVATESEFSRIQALIAAAAECHLIKDEQSEENRGDADDDYDDGEPAEKMNRRSPCELCQTKMLLTEYECTIFDKTFNETRQEGEGTWKPSRQEWITRTLQYALRRETGDMSLVKESETFSELMETLKAEYKELTKYWIEIDFTVAAFDELNMCKLQLTTVDPRTLKKKEKMKRNEISIFEVESTKVELKAELDSVEMSFLKAMKNLSYLRHLSSQHEVQICPICDLKPEERYTVWDCGHQFCIRCVLVLKKHNGVKLKCPICRNLQEFKE